ncbi:uncharacterized protein TNCV_4672701 [Trichonephila clavipes]|nr:uncharacterized protein TNCV_4672701 [Trichonephila clavipes]
MSEKSTVGLISTYFSSHAENVALKKKLNSCELIGIKNIPEINRRSVLAMRYIGQGLSSLETFCSLMCLLNPVSQKAYDRINAKIADISEALANASMKKAATEEKIIDRTVNSVVVNSDGTWKTRGHTSLIGVCALIGTDCGKVLDMEVMSSYCKGCDSDKGPKLGPKYSAFLANHHIFCRKKPLQICWKNGSLRNAENFSPIRTKTWIKVSAIHR